ncbi:MAG: DALR anticodon-binding domain-containing protein [Thermoproteota archaeon]|nr:DALR anticodon-binding domain-containing protein [Thermoproteota archaeon]
MGIDRKKYKYLGYETVTLSQSTAQQTGINHENKKSMQMSGRKGIFVEADIALDLLIQKSYEQIKKRNKDLSEKDIDYIASEIAISALRYFFIKHDLEKSITFDINDSLSLEGDTGPYIQYSYARGKKILKNTGSHELPENINFNDIKLSEKEIELLKHLCKFTEQIKESVNNTEPKIIARYLFALSTIFNNFYEESPIMKETGILKEIRISILKSTIKVMSYCMCILGITTLDTM